MKSIYFHILSGINRLFLRFLIDKKPRLHVGCGFNRLSSFINVDINPTRATDIICDCGTLDIFPDHSFTTIYCHAFLEHLYFDQRPIHLKNVYRILKKGGAAVYLGIPDFEAVARAYLNKETGIIFRNFGIEEVYRYTHGLTEEVSRKNWIYQLHKTLFDSTSLKKLLLHAGFKSFCIFRYAFEDEKLSINLGFIACKGKPIIKFDQKEINHFLRRYDNLNLQIAKILVYM